MDTQTHRHTRTHAHKRAPRKQNTKRNPSGRQEQTAFLWRRERAAVHTQTCNNARTHADPHRGPIMGDREMGPGVQGEGGQKEPPFGGVETHTYFGTSRLCAGPAGLQGPGLYAQAQAWEGPPTRLQRENYAISASVCAKATSAGGHLLLKQHAARAAARTCAPTSPGARNHQLAYICKTLIAAQGWPKTSSLRNGAVSPPMLHPPRPYEHRQL
mmetsp:Transcript_108356/g.183479  ORF Transcript_108356/g.183479 Transcript_108356/m.183479 type:complete len:214 (+) Transcript_108356:618-1259(+)